MGLFDFLLGEAPTYTPGVIEHPLAGFGGDLGSYLQALLGGGGIGAPKVPYELDIPLSPTNQMWGGMAQSYGVSPAPYIMGQAAGTLGNLMNPNMNLNAMDRLGGMFAGKDPTNLFDPFGGNTGGLV
ncbi:MAG: hypothetical protein V3W37_06190 [Candidatus Binatia bacterium]